MRIRNATQNAPVHVDAFALLPPVMRPKLTRHSTHTERTLMDIRFLGPLGVVTGSCAWLRDAGRNWNFLVDCGMQQGEHGAGAWNRDAWPFDPSTLQFVVLTHAHMDHSGLLPRLYRDGFRGTVYCTRETRDLAVILLNDAAGQQDALYTRDDVARIRWHEPGRLPLLGDSYHPVGTDLFLRFFRAGHIMGAVSAVIYWGARGENQRSIVFSGDLGPCAEDRENLPFLRFRMHPVACDYAVVESTYGGTVRDPSETLVGARRTRLRGLLDQTVYSGGTLVLPAFALGRTQDLLFDLHWLVAEDPQRYGALQFYFDAPTAARMHAPLLAGLQRTESNGRKGKVRPLWLGKQMFRWLDLDDANPQHVARALDIAAMTLGLPRESGRASDRAGNAVARAWRPLMRQVGDRRALLRDGLPGPSVLVTGAGSCDGGPAAAWLPVLLQSDHTTLALTGYCAPASIGGQLLALGTTAPAERARHTGLLRWPGGQALPAAQVRAAVCQLHGYSAHADQAGLLDWLFWDFKGTWNASGRTVFVQHGEDRARRGLTGAAHRRAGELGMAIHTVAPGDPSTWYDLDAGGAAVVAAEQATALRAELERIRMQLAALENAA
jgi:metallo-beta-lactamase family protein